jgi:hypothetical protein
VAGEGAAWRDLDRWFAVVLDDGHPPRGRPPGVKRVATVCDSDGVSPTRRVRRLCGFLIWVKWWGWLVDCAWRWVDRHIQLGSEDGLSWTDSCHRNTLSGKPGTENIDKLNVKDDKRM